MCAVDRKLAGADDVVQAGAGDDGDGMPRLVARVGLFMGEGTRHVVRNVLDQAAPEDDVKKLLAAADAEDRHVEGEGRRG